MDNVRTDWRVDCSQLFVLPGMHIVLKKKKLTNFHAVQWFQLLSVCSRCVLWNIDLKSWVKCN